MDSTFSLVNNWPLLAIAAGVLLVLLVGGALVGKRRVRLDTEKFRTRWDEIQHLCANGETWPLAVINADTVLDEALKACRYKGKTMGARLVAAQRDLSDNDGVWFGHKLRNKLVHEEIPRLYKRDVQNALRGFRQALKDLGAL
jgi:hypothetical protein